MGMCDFISREAIIPALTATTKEGVIREMVESLHRAGFFREAEVEDIVRAVLRREQLGSTGIGRGIAIPHAKYATAHRMIGTLALSRSGVNFDSVDGEPVYVFVLLLSPQDKPGDHLRALESVVRSMREDSFVRSLRGQTTGEGVWQLLC
jgi:PTS system fructose-specific IIA component/PTS system nitrogen regulatory IIA component